MRGMRLSKAGFPLGEFVRTNREKKQLVDCLATNTDDITTQSHSIFACSREKFLKWKTGLTPDDLTRQG